ncbi:MAG: GC-type dockerin domain-anchored protein [Phycisphaerales bacterium]
MRSKIPDPRAHSQIVRPLVISLLVSAWSALPATAQPPTITNLGILPLTSSSAGYGISDDGSAVCGYSSNSAFRWTDPAAGGAGLQNLGFLPNPNFSTSAIAYAISGNGQIVAGESQLFGFIWSAGVMRRLPALPDGIGPGWSRVSGASADGSFLCGYSTYSVFGNRNLAVRWTNATGGFPNVESLVPLNSTMDSGTAGISADGSVVVGSNGGQPFRWTTNGGLQYLGRLEGGTTSTATAVSGDGAVVVGWGDSNDGTVAFRWTGAGGLQSLGALPGDTFSAGNGVSGDGSQIVGQSAASAIGRTFLWTTTMGMVDLSAYLASLGVNLAGWTLRGASAISTDGTAITGFGTFNGQNRAWVVRGLPGCKPAFTVQPAAATTCILGTAVFNVAATAATAFTYRWQWLDATSPGTWLDITEGQNTLAATLLFRAQGAHSASLSLDRSAGGWAAGGSVRCVITGACGSTTSNAATLTISCPNIADVAGLGGSPGCDGKRTADDVVFYLAAFFAGNLQVADVAALGGVIHPDGMLTPDDLIAFVGALFAPCP